MVIQYQSLKDHVYNYLYDKINSGRLKPRSKINEKQICNDLNVSRTPIREALIQLEDEGYVERLPRRGFIVKEITADKIKEIFEIIGCLEGKAGEMAVDRIKPKDILSMEELVQKSAECIKKRKLREYFTHQRNFHNVYILASGNSELYNLILSLKKRFIKKAYFGKQNNDALYQRLEMNIKEHKKIIQFFKNKDKEGVDKFLRNVHWSAQHTERIVSPFI
jgi:DNA-binding GntR family transcriptional regulator